MVPELTVRHHVATIALQRPSQANKLTPEDIEVLKEHIRVVDADESIRVLKIASHGRHFCSGYDISELKSSGPEPFSVMVDALENCRPATVAVVQGGVFGGATDLALACDFRVGSQASRMFMPAARLGLHYYYTGMCRYVDRLGLDVSKRLFLTAEDLDAQTMRDVGFLTHLAPEGKELDGYVEQLCETLVSMAPLAMLGMKKHLNQIAKGIVKEGDVAAAVRQTVLSADLQEGARAWAEKRRPNFSGL